MPWDPMKGERLAPAWVAVKKLLEGGGQFAWGHVVREMLDASDLQRSTCNGLLYAAVKNGYLTRTGKYNQKTKRDTRKLAWTGKEFR